MSMRYLINNGETISPAMSWDFGGASIYVLFFNGAGQPVDVTGMPSIYRSVQDSGSKWQQVQPFANGEWRANGPISRVRVDLAGVTGYATYQVVIWRSDDPLPMIPDGTYSGYRAQIAQSYTEANVKSGAQFSASTYLTGLTAGEFIDIIVITGAKKVIIKGQYIELKDSGDVLIDWYKNPTYSAGTNISAGVFNQSDVTRLPSTVQLIGLLPTNAATGNYTPNDATKVTVTAVGTKICPTLAVLGVIGQGASQSSRAATEGLEHVLDANSTYLFRRTCIAAAASMYSFSTWFEGEPDLPLGA